MSSTIQIRGVYFAFTEKNMFYSSINFYKIGRNFNYIF